MALFGKLTDLAGGLSKAVSGELAKKATGGALAAAAGLAAGAAISKAVKKKETPSALSTAPAPAVPKFNTLSVMVAVNGQTYGPYEKATLLEMVSNGSLTADTLVFMKGMADWKRAAEVVQVAALLATKAPLPPTPPVPWASAPAAPAAAPVQEMKYNNSLSPRLNQLIESAVADGEISDLERQVLIRNCQEEGVPMDEFVMVLEARLYEQRKVLAAQQEEQAHRAKSLEMQHQVAMAAAAPAAPAQARPTKCPHCGAPVKALTTSCPDCGHDYNFVNSSAAGMSAWERLAHKIQEINEKPEGEHGFWDTDYTTKTEMIVSAINNCAIPTDKNELVDFMISCAPLGKPSGFWANKSSDEVDIEKAYRAKAQQVLLKARIVLKSDKDLLQQIEDIAVEYKIKAK